MRYANHNFKNNFISIIKSKDMKISRELVVSEIGKVIQGKTFQVRQLLDSCGINVSTTASLKEIVYAVNFNMAKSKCLRDGIARLVMENQAMSNVSGYMNQDGNGNQQGGGSGSSFNWGAGINAFSTVAGIWYGVSEGNKNREEMALQRQHEREMATIHSDLMLKQMEYDASKPPPQVIQGGMSGNKTILYILLGLGAVGIIAVILKKNK